MAKDPKLPPDDEKRKVDGTLNLPSDLDPEPSSPELETSEKDAPPLTGSLHIDPAPSASDVNAKTLLSGFDDDFDDVDPDGILSSSFAGIRSDLTETINPEQLNESERREVEEILKQALKGGTQTRGTGPGTTPGTIPGTAPGSMPASAPGSSAGHVTIGGVESRLVLQSRQVVPFRATDITAADYKLKNVLGEGGMGTVFLAEQMSLERMVAVKVIKPISAQEREKLSTSGKLAHHERQRREQFLSEAVVTGALDHPNIVPIHDVGRTGDNSPFYSMKQVEGTAWRDVIGKNTQSENLDILLKVADAVAFAHSRGVVHRDIKPENVMLGDFGVVMLMDWGLALVTPDFPRYGALKQVNSFGGSPAYMAPEMVGRIEKVTPSSDIYLLGAALFEVITGTPPHPHPKGELTGWDSVRKYLEQVVRPNVIAEVKPEHKGELLDVALKAMATLKDDRYASVQEFQAAIRSYRSHAESIQLASRAGQELEKAVETKEYGDYARAVFGYEEAIELWSGNTPAAVGLLDAKLAYAERASEKEDYDLGLSLLDREDARHKPLITRLEKGRHERASRQKRLKLAYGATMALSVALLTGGLYSLKLIADASQATQLAAEAEKKTEEAEGKLATAQTRLGVVEEEANAKIAAADAEAQRRTDEADRKVDEANVKVAAADEAAQESQEKALLFEEQAMQSAMEAMIAQTTATKAMEDAADATELAEEQKKAAAEAIATADKAKAAADDASKLAVFEEYASQIALARTRIEQNEFEDARRILNNIKTQRDAEKKPLEWEWKWLWRQANQSESAVTLPAPGTDVSLLSDGSGAVVSLEGGQLQDVAVDAKGDMELAQQPMTPAGKAGSLSILSPDESLVATAGSDGLIRLSDPKTGNEIATLSGHEAGQTIRRLLFLPDGRLLSASDDHTVRLWDTKTHQEIAEAWHIGPVHDIAAATSADGVVIAAAVADLRGGRVAIWAPPAAGEDRLQPLGEFAEHYGPVSAVAVSPDGRRFASGDARGRVLVWDMRSLLRNQEMRAVLRDAVKAMNDPQAIPTASRRSTAMELSDPRSGVGFVLTGSGPKRPAHESDVTRIAFSRDGRQILTTSADYSAKVWNANDGSLRKTMLGHGGGVLSAEFLGDDGERVLTTGVDRTARTWLTSAGDGAAEYRASTMQAHDDAIWSAAFDRTSSRIITAGRDHSARILEFDAATSTFHDVGELMDDTATPRADNRPLIEGARFVAFSVATRADGKRLYVGDIEGFVRIWDMQRAVELASIPDTGFNMGLALSRDGRRLLTGNRDKSVPARLWRLNAEGVPDGSAPLDLRPTSEAESYSMTALAISPNGEQLFTGLLRGQAGVGILWSAETGKELARIGEHGQRINAAVFSPDGKTLYLATDDGLIDYSIEDRRIRQVLPHGEVVAAVDISDDGQRLLSVSWGNTATGNRSKLWLWTLSRDGGDAISEVLEERQFTRDGTPTATDRVVSARFAADSENAVSVTNSRDSNLSEMRVWSLPHQGEPSVRQVVRFPTAVTAADLAMVTVDPASGQPRWLTLHGDAVFRWNPKTLRHEHSYRQSSGLTEAAFSPDGRFAATASRSVVIWDVNTRRSLAKVEAPHQGPVYTLSWDPTSPGRFATAGRDSGNGEPGHVRIWNWNPETNEITEAGGFPVDSAIRRVRWSEDGRQLLAVGDDGKARVWTVAEPAAAPRIFSDSGLPRAAFLAGEFSPDAKQILVGGADGIARIWNLDSPAEQDATPWARLQGHADAITAVGFLNDKESGGALRYLTASRDKSARLWDVQDVRNLTMNDPVRVREVLALRRHDLGLTSVQASADGRTLMTAGLDGRVILWPAGAGEL